MSRVIGNFGRRAFQFFGMAPWPLSADFKRASMRFSASYRPLEFLANGWLAWIKVTWEPKRHPLGTFHGDNIYLHSRSSEYILTVIGRIVLNYFYNFILCLKFKQGLSSDSTKPIHGEQLMQSETIKKERLYTSCAEYTSFADKDNRRTNWLRCVPWIARLEQP